MTFFCYGLEVLHLLELPRGGLLINLDGAGRYASARRRRIVAPLARSLLRFACCPALGRRLASLWQLRLRTQIQLDKQRLHCALEELQLIQKSFVFGESEAIDAEAVRVKLSAQLTALACWHWAVIRDPLVVHAASRLGLA